MPLYPPASTTGYTPGGTDVAVTDGGTGASTASGARTNLGLAIGTDVRAQGSGDPTSLAASVITVADAGSLLTATEVETALQELALKGIGYSAHGNTGSTETFSALTGWHSATLNANCTFTLTAAPSGTSSNLLLELLQDGTGGWAITLPASVTNKSALEAAQVTTLSTTSFLALWSRDGGTTWYGAWVGVAGSADSDATVTFTDITTNNASTSKHGFLKKLSNVSTEYMSGTGVWSTPGGGGGGTTISSTCQGRLTLTTAVPVTTSDVTAATTLYFTPFRGNLVGTYSGSAWSVNAFTEKSITLATLTSGLPYDVFIVDSTLALELLAWTNATTRATALVLQDGILCKTGALTRRYLGTICIAATGQCEDSLLRRLVWNYYNRTERPLQVFDGTNTWTKASGTDWRQARATATNQVDYVCGVSEDLVIANVQASANPETGHSAAVGVGVDATTTNSAQLFTEIYSAGPTDGSTLLAARYRGWPGVGYHYLAWLEYARAGTTTFIGDNGVGDMQSGLLAEVLG